MVEREREITLRSLAGPIDMNIYGKVHGGAVMRWIDETAYACAAAWSGQFCVTIYVSGIVQDNRISVVFAFLRICVENGANDPIHLPDMAVINAWKRMPEK